MDNSHKILRSCILRRFGVEIEVNAFDMRNRPLGYDVGRLPSGIYEVASVVQAAAKDRVYVQKWGNNHNNDTWIVKPDSSCGMEICTPVCKGVAGLRSVCAVVDALGRDSRISADERCSLHVHVDVHDLSTDQIGSIIAWWIKCEYAISAIVPIKRRKNKYCQFVSTSDIIVDIKEPMLESSELISMIGEHKYLSLNTYHLYNRRRQTIEFRFMDSSACLNYHDAKNYLKFIMTFVSAAVARGLPPNYISGNKMTGYAWLDGIDVAEMLGLMNPTISKGMSELAVWMMGRILKCENKEENGVFGLFFSKSSGWDDFLNKHKNDVKQSFSFSKDNFSL